MKGKGWKFTKDTPQQKHVEEIGKVQSQVFTSYCSLRTAEVTVVTLR